MSGFRGNPVPGTRGLVGVFTSDAVLELDITEALQSIGCGVLAVHDYDTGLIETIRPGELSAAVVDLKADLEPADRSVSELTRHRIPTVVLLSEDSQMNGMSGMPGVIACFRKPVIVDSILPEIRALTEARAGMTPPRPQQPPSGQEA